MKLKATIHLAHYSEGVNVIQKARGAFEDICHLGGEINSLRASGEWSLEESEITLHAHNIETDIFNPRVRTIGLGVSRIKPTDRSVILIEAVFPQGKQKWLGPSFKTPGGFRVEYEGQTIEIPSVPCEDFVPTILLDEGPEEEFDEPPPPEFCPHTFKDSACQYLGAMIACDKTWEHCAARGNLENFGGRHPVEAEPDPNCVGCGGSGEVSDENGDGGPCACLYRDFEDGSE